MGLAEAESKWCMDGRNLDSSQRGRHMESAERAYSTPAACMGCGSSHWSWPSACTQYKVFFLVPWLLAVLLR